MPTRTMNVRFLRTRLAAASARRAVQRFHLREFVIFAALASALIATVTVALLPAPSYPVYNGSGERLESLCAGVAPDPEAKVSFLRDGAGARGASDPCQKAPALVRHLASWINPPSASAYSCGADCNGHNMVSRYRPCPQGCDTTGGHYCYYSDPQNSPWHVGWQDAVDLACGECGPWAERSCTNRY